MARNIYDDILRDARVKLTEMFDNNFREQGFFGQKWVATKVSKVNKRGKGSILIVTGAMRRSIRSMVRGMSVVFFFPSALHSAPQRGGQLLRHCPGSFPDQQENREHLHRALTLAADDYAAAPVHRRPRKGAAGSRRHRL